METSELESQFDIPFSTYASVLDSTAVLAASEGSGDFATANASLRVVS